MERYRPLRVNDLFPNMAQRDVGKPTAQKTAASSYLGYFTLNVSTMRCETLLLSNLLQFILLGICIQGMVRFVNTLCVQSMSTVVLQIINQPLFIITEKGTVYRSQCTTKKNYVFSMWKCTENLQSSQAYYTCQPFPLLLSMHVKQPLLERVPHTKVRDAARSGAPPFVGAAPPTPNLSRIAVP